MPLPRSPEKTGNANWKRTNPLGSLILRQIFSSKASALCQYTAAPVSIAAPDGANEGCQWKSLARQPRVPWQSTISRSRPKTAQIWAGQRPPAASGQSRNSISTGGPLVSSALSKKLKNFVHQAGVQAWLGLGAVVVGVFDWQARTWSSG